MDPNELLASLRILAHVIRAGTRLRTEEKLVFEGVGAAEVHRSTSELLAETTNLDEQIQKVVSPALRERTLELAVALAATDGRCTPEEEAVLQRIREGFGAQEKVDLTAEEALWKQRSRAFRAGLNEAETTFLHRVHDEQERGELTQARYEQEAAALARLKDEIRKSFLGDVGTLSTGGS